MKTLFASLKDLFQIDVRSLALFRVALALLVIRDLTLRLTALEAHYTDVGVLPRAALAQLVDGPVLSFHLVGGGTLVQGALFAVAASMAALLLVGWRTRWMAAGLWVWLFSMQQRNPFVLDVGDDILRFMLLWAIFVPLGACWSLDARRDDEPGQTPPTMVYSAATAALLLQGAWLYFVGGIAKLSNASWREGDALFMLLERPGVARPLGELLVGQPEVLRAVTWLSPWLEIVLACGLLVPWFRELLRPMCVALACVYHLFLFACVSTGLLQPVLVVLLLPFLPAFVWDSAAWLRLPESRAEPVSKPWLVRVTAVLATMVLVYCAYAQATVVFGAQKARLSLLSNIDAVPPGWFVLVGYLRDGSKVDIARADQQLSFKRPSKPAWSGDWQLYWRWVMHEERAPFREGLAEYYCTVWNRHAQPSRLGEIEIVYTDEVRDSPEVIVRRLCPLADGTMPKSMAVSPPPMVPPEPSVAPKKAKKQQNVDDPLSVLRADGYLMEKGPELAEAIVPEGALRVKLVWMRPSDGSAKLSAWVVEFPDGEAAQKYSASRPPASESPEPTQRFVKAQFAVEFVLLEGHPNALRRSVELAQ